MKQTTAPARRDIYQRITDQIVAQLEQGVLPWHQPWSADHLADRVTRPLRHNGLPYNGINVLMLWGASIEHGYATSIWMTYRQAIELGAHVRKGEKGSTVAYANKLSRTESDPDSGEDATRDIHYLKSYTVFNVAQIEGTLYASPFGNAPMPPEHTVEGQGAPPVRSNMPLWPAKT